VRRAFHISAHVAMPCYESLHLASFIPSSHHDEPRHSPSSQLR
jgi:hypothetical protein